MILHPAPESLIGKGVIMENHILLSRNKRTSDAITSDTPIIALVLPVDVNYGSKSFSVGHPTK